MKKFVNKSKQLRTVLFKDGTAQFLMRGQSFISNKEVESVQQGIVITEVVEDKKPAASKEAK